jgi:hypothetical protein
MFGDKNEEDILNKYGSIEDEENIMCLRHGTDELTCSRIIKKNT